MPVKITEQDLSTAIKSTTTAKRAAFSAVTPDQARQQKWGQVREEAASAICADPDVAIQYTYLCSNKARVAALTFQGLLSALVLTVEASVQKEPAVSLKAKEDRAAYTSRAKAQIIGAQIQGAVDSQELKKNVGRALAVSAKKYSGRATASTARGAESRALIRPLLKETTALGAELARLLSALRTTGRGSLQSMSSIAVRGATTSLWQSLKDDSKAGILQVASSMGRVAMSANPGTIGELVSTGEAIPTPITFQVSSDGLTITISGESTGSLRVQAGDGVIDNFGTTAEIASVEDYEITLSSAISASTTNFRVRTPAQAVFIAFVEKLSGVSVSFSASALTSPSAQNSANAPRARKAISSLLTTLAVLGPIPTEVKRAAQAVSADIPDDPEDGGLISLLGDYVPPVRSGAAGTARAILDKMDGGGFSGASRKLLSLQFSSALPSDALAAQSGADVDAAFKSFSSAYSRGSTLKGGR